MKRFLSFEVAGRPQQRGSKRPMPRKGGGPALMIDDNPRSKPWMAAVASVASQAMNGETLMDGPLHIKVWFWFKRPKSHYRSNGDLKATAPEWHASRPDCDKLLRSIGDALSGVVYRDDSQLAEVVAEKRYTENSECVVVRVEQL